MAEILRYEPEQEPPDEDIENFVFGARGRLRILPFQTSRYVLRETRQTLSWIKAYIACEIDDLKSEFVCKDKSFYIALIENILTGDRSVSFRLTTDGVAGCTEWRVSIRRVSFEGSDEYFLCAEY
ncbi:hypothetical protein [Sphingosinicella xenopeptidilytica]|uniref:Uncharacterized protein n=1 Tax=Sphingosinicella xenopeptidilytica TaxID=364098 RepID=A0ABW3C7W5_SPHXN